LSFLGLAPFSRNAWADQTKMIEEKARVLLEDELICASREVKEHKFSLGQVK